MIKNLVLILALTFALYANEIDDLKINFINLTQEVVTIVKNKNLLADTRNDKNMKAVGDLIKGFEKNKPLGNFQGEVILNIKSYRPCG